MLKEEHRVREGLDIWVIPNFAQDVLHFDPAKLQDQLESNYPVRGAGESIDPDVVQWIDGDNDSLKYRGNVLKRAKIWLQRRHKSQGFRRYGYTGWQWSILPATAWLNQCPEVLPIADWYDAWAIQRGYPLANHYIVTRYADGEHGIGFHSDKIKDIEPNSLITVVKTGHHGRPFELCFPGEEKTPFFSQVLDPGTAVIMTVDANVATKHGVPVVDEAGPSGSIVFRTIKTEISNETLAKELRKRKRE